MPEKWNDSREKRLLLEVIAATNLTVERSTWDRIAATMGDDLTAEACRQKFQGIKRNLKATNGNATQENTTAPKSFKATRPKISASASASASAAGTKNRKRKAAEANLNEDDDESTIIPPKPHKLKKENDSEAEVLAEVFKIEKDGEHVDLVNDDLYAA